MEDWREWEFVLDAQFSWIQAAVDKNHGEDFNLYFTGESDQDIGTPCFNSRLVASEDEVDFVWQIGYEVVSVYNGARRALGKEDKVALSGLIWRGRSQSYCENMELPWLLETQSTNAHVQASNRGISQESRLIELAQSDRGVYVVLKLLSYTPNWVVLYQLMETLDQLGKKHDPMSKSERDKFTNSANDLSVGGINSRHGLSSNKKSNFKKSLSIRAADGFITKYAGSFIQEKL